MISIKNISKTYGKVTALKGINLEVEAGELFGLIGPDGAGKTSMIRILATLLLADSGSAEVLGQDVVKGYKNLRSRMGYMPGRFSLYMDLSVEENLELFATIFGTTIQENYDLVRDIYVQLEPFKKRRAGALSGGMKQKLALCCALIHKPEILFLDEPTTGVDPVSRKEFWGMLKKLRGHQITILVSTPYMDEASLCDRVALIQEGSILTVDTPQAIIDGFSRPLLAISGHNKYQLLNDLRAYPSVHSVFPFGDSLHYTDQAGTVGPERIQQYLLEKGHSEIEIAYTQPTIEDCFMELM